MELSDLSRKDQEQYAFFLGLAALLGEGVYNLGELVRDLRGDKSYYGIRDHVLFLQRNKIQILKWKNG